MQKILVVIDMQNDFINGSLGTVEAQGIVKNVVEKIRSYQGCKVFATRDTHGSDYLETLEGKHLPVSHCIKGTKGWEIQQEVADALLEVGAEVIDKGTFGSNALADQLYEAAGSEESEIELVGLCTDICVISNGLLIKAKLPQVPVKVDPDCCAGVTKESHEAALLTMKMCQIDFS
ncbi:cysteine hydrolase family protein [Parablautia muri]|uniref:nicotinamidase n=1 Tax=Parablautia muri TaxID=2320879 RepID=A0A9X5GSG3_9FIRM|nr:isochorismatase family cysteine hydrolase [Parablautia muri]NBJ93174.1 cysteine hydrolase [Parablautia muri]